MLERHLTEVPFSFFTLPQMNGFFACQPLDNRWEVNEKGPNLQIAPFLVHAGESYIPPPISFISSAVLIS